MVVLSRIFIPSSPFFHADPCTAPTSAAILPSLPSVSLLLFCYPSRPSVSLLLFCCSFRLILLFLQPQLSVSPLVFSLPRLLFALPPMFSSLPHRCRAFLPSASAVVLSSPAVLPPAAAAIASSACAVFPSVRSNAHFFLTRLILRRHQRTERRSK